MYDQITFFFETTLDVLLFCQHSWTGALFLAGYLKKLWVDVNKTLVESLVMGQKRADKFFMLAGVAVAITHHKIVS